MNETKHGDSLISRSKKTAGKLALLGVCFLLLNTTGCITAAVTATVVYVMSTLEYTASVEVQASPQKVYDTMNKILKQHPDVEVISRDDNKLCLEIKKGKNTAKAQVSVNPNGATLLKVTARENESEASHKDLAFKIVTKVCDELGVKYKISEKTVK